jgi:hypothetical protein
MLSCIGLCLLKVSLGAFFSVLRMHLFFLAEMNIKHFNLDRGYLKQRREE